MTKNRKSRTVGRRAWRKPLAGALAAAIALVLGCFSSESGAPARPDDGGRKILRYPRISEHKTLDPMMQFDQASAEIITNLYDTLLEYHYLARPYELVPGLLARMPERQADGVTYELTLKQGVHFADDPAFPAGAGRELVVDDVIYSIKRFADANVNAKSYILAQGTIVGLDDFRDQTRRLGKAVDYDLLDVPGLQRIDDHRMRIVFTGANPLALYPLAASPLSIVAREAVEKYGEDFADHPVGTGPFRLSRLDRRGTIVLVKNPDYHGRYPDRGEPGDAERGLLADAGKPLPLLDEVHLPLMEEAQPRMLTFRKGQLDWIPVDKDNFRKMASRDADGTFHLKPPYDTQFEMYAEPGLSVEYIAFNLRDPVVGSNKALRQAIAWALDIDRWIEILRNGRAMPLATIVPHPIAGSERDIDVDYYRHDPEKAREKLAEAGYPEGKGLPPITFEYRHTNKDARQEFEFIRNELAAVGIQAVGNFQTFSAYLQRIESGNFQVGVSGWAADYPDAENFYQLLYSANRTPGPNMSEFANDEYDRLYERSRFMVNGPERFALFRRMSEIVREEVPVILRFNRLAFGLHLQELRNLKRNIMIDAPYRFLDVEIGAEDLMLTYVIRRLLHMIPIVIGVALLVFLLFSTVGEDPVRVALGAHATPEAIADLTRQWGLDRPLPVQFLDFLRQIATLDFGRSYNTGEQLSEIFRRGAVVSLSVTLPPFVAGMLLNVGAALLIAYFRGSWLDRWSTALFVASMSISYLVYIITFQYVFAFELDWFPISGYADGLEAVPFLMLPWIIIIVVSAGPEIRVLRTVFLDETRADYVRTAFAKGASESQVLFKHILKNAMIPVLTQWAIAIPFLILGAFLMERFFSIPGIGDILINAINTGDRPIIKGLTVLIAIAYSFFNLLTDILYAYVDPRVQLE